jgi:C1A family cysteine protease
MLMPEGQEKKVELFADFKDFHEKSYKDVTQETQRMVNFHHNVRYINSMNRQGLSYHLKVNHMADLSEEERRSRVRGRLNRKENNGANFSYVLSSPRKGEEIDWRKAGAVTPVKDQGSCGSCWTFGTTGVLEGQIYKKYKKLYDLSSQVLMDCS